MEPIKRSARVTIEKDYDIEFMPSVFMGMTEEEYLESFSRHLWPVESMDDVAKYAARMAAYYGGGLQHDGLGLLGERDCCYPGGKLPDVIFTELSDECEEEILR